MKIVYIHTMLTYGIEQLVFVVMVTNLPWEQKFLKVLFPSLHPSTNYQLQGFHGT